MVKARDLDPKQNTNKKLRTILLAHYAGDVISLVEKFDPIPDDPLKGDDGFPKAEPAPTEPEPAPEPEPTDEIPMEPVPEDEPEPENQAAYEEGVKAEAESAVDPGTDTNKFDIEVPELVEGKRSFDQVKTLFEEMANSAGLDNKAFESLITTKFPQFQHYRMKEDFCYKAPTSEVNTLLNSI